MGNEFKLVGESSDGRPVLAGLYDTYQREGIPMTIGLNVMCRDGLIPSWAHEVDAMRAHGMGNKAIIAKIAEALYDSNWDLEWSDEVIRRLCKAMPL